MKRRHPCCLALLGPLVASVLLSGCSAVTSALARAAPVVTAELLEPGGKGLFVVRPFAADPACTVALKSPNTPTPVDCNSEFLVGCDGAIPDSKPFCSLIREKGRVRSSPYPGNRR